MFGGVLHHDKAGLLLCIPLIHLQEFFHLIGK